MPLGPLPTVRYVEGMQRLALRNAAIPRLLLPSPRITYAIIVAANRQSRMVWAASMLLYTEIANRRLGWLSCRWPVRQAELVECSVAYAQQRGRSSFGQRSRQPRFDIQRLFQSHRRAKSRSSVTSYREG